MVDIVSCALKPYGVKGNRGWKYKMKRSKAQERAFKIPAIVFGGGINGLGVVRNLGRNNVTVHCAVERKEQVVYSKFCGKHYIVPHIEENKSVLRKFLISMARLNSHAVVFPTSDRFSLHLSELKEELNEDYYIPLPSQEIVRTLVDKKRFYKSLSRFNVPHPNTCFPESQEDVRRISTEMKYPIFMKPVLSQEFCLKFHKKGFVAGSADELMKYYIVARNHGFDVLLQEVIPGFSGKNVYGIEGYFDKNSDPKAIFAYRRLRGWPPVFGNTCLRESIPTSDVASLCTITENYLRRIGYHGLMEAEWKKDPRNGVYNLLEINARQSMQSVLPSVCGMNLILTAYLDVIGEKIGHVDDYEKGVKWQSPPEDLLSIITTHPSMVDLAISLRNSRAWSFFATDDLLPWIVSNFEMTRTAVFRIFEVARMHLRSHAEFD
jgi:predicted ATP-grasp superfamily ATP-dependent carboligase